MVADELPLVRLGVQAALQPLGVKVAAEVDTGRDAVRVAESERPGLVVLGALRDVPLSETVRRVRALEPAPRVIVLLPRTQRDELAALLSLDTEALVLRDVATEELMLVVERVLAGERVVAPAVLSSLVGVSAATPEVGEQALTGRELEVLALLARGRSNREIAAELFVTLATVKTHLQHVYAKLGARNRNEALGRAQHLGLLD